MAQVGLGGHAAIETDDALAAAATCFEFFDHGIERGGVAGFAVEDFEAERKAGAIDDQADAQLFAIGPMIARVATLGFGVALHAAFEVSTGKIV